MKPKIYDVEFISQDELEVGMELIVVDEFKASDKFKGFLHGTVALPNDEKRLLSLNKTSYVEIAKTLGKDTAEWTGKSLIYKGIQKMGAMEGKLFAGME